MLFPLQAWQARAARWCPSEPCKGSAQTYPRSIKTTIDIPEKVLAEAVRFTGAKNKKEAIVRALEDFNRRHKMAALVKYSGTFESMMTNEEIEGLEKTKGRMAGLRDQKLRAKK